MSKFILIISIALALFIFGCQEETGVLNQTAGDNAQIAFLAKGTETLGSDILITEGSGIVAAGTGLVKVTSGVINLYVPGDVVQALIYWSGGTNVIPTVGDNTIEVDGTPITGELIGGPAFFYGSYDFFAYRYDITGLVSYGDNTFIISGMDFPYTGPNDENCGAGILVIYDDGTSAEIDLRDGLDLAYWNFPDPRKTTIPQTFSFTAADEEREANLTNFAGSVGLNRPNEIQVTINGSVQAFTDPLGSNDGLLWDTAVLNITIPAGATELTVEAISTPSADPNGASLCWVVAALSVPVIEQEPAEIGDFVWEDLNRDGIQDQGEPGIAGITVHLMDCADNTLATTVTDADGYYLFTDLEPGDYNIHFVKPNGYYFSPQDRGSDDALDSDADMNGFTVCTTLEAGESDLTWDAGLYMPDAPGTGTPGYWKNHPEAWPVEKIDIGEETYSMAEAIDNMKHPVKKDKTYTMFASLVCAKLNVLIGNDDSCISDTIVDADDWMSDHEVGSGVKASSGAWKDGEPWHLLLDDYNNGRLPCADPRD